MDHETPPALNVYQPNAARLYDYVLGGAANFAVDRAAGDDLLAAMPDMEFSIQCNRAFLTRAVRYLAGELGIDQFLDLGSGVPTVGNVHEVAQREIPHARVAYVDFETIAVHHARRDLAGNPHATITEADIRDVTTVLHAPGVADLLDFTRPIALLTIGILHYITDDTECHRMLTAYRHALPSGSYWALTHVAATSDTTEMRAAHTVMARTETPSCDRSPEQIRPFLAGTTLLEPGLVPTPTWHPRRQPDDGSLRRCNNYGALTSLP